ncbi:serine aminopeptidase domain-containing protein [Phenylobacterium sp.]|uniref:serine aminopeptidase domain-containing protein n=1 Tax=Phenylobacterium sp. TaxID=1871053 RepID=UPI002DE535BF|nr:alpha/beta fold hydrolase [Phenylobacterium sp.]
MEATEAAHRIARPVAFDGCAGWLHPAQGRTAVLLCSPWGYEALCLRRAWRMLGDAFAAAGFPTLRFDYPGTGDSLGDAEDVVSLETLKTSIRRAAEELRTLSGAKHIVLVGQGLGASLAAAVATELDAAGLALLAPIVRGREYLRELSVWGLTVAEAMQLETGSTAPGAVAGFALPEGLREEIAALDMLAGAVRLPPTLLALRGRVAELKLVRRLDELGGAVSETSYAAYDQAIGNPTVARPPRETLEAVVDWVTTTLGAGGPPIGPSEPAAAILEAPDFVETTVRFGADHRLCGVLCEPRGARRGATVLMLGAGGDPHIGWARGAVEQARTLAREGIASFRMDASDVGDAAGPLTGESVQLYDERHIDDARAGFDWLMARGLGPVLPVGRCSGAFAAFNAAARDPRISDIILVNQLRYIWNNSGEFDAASEKVGYYRKQVRNPAKLFMRWLRGDVDLDVALAKFGSASIALAHATLQGQARQRRRQIRETFGGLQKRGVRVNLLISRDREAHEVFRQFFGAEGARLRRYGDLRLSFLEGADHALTPRAAREALLALIRETALAGPETSAQAVAAQDPAAERERFALRPAGRGLLPT